jgi:hypothetical protein
MKDKIKAFVREAKEDPYTRGIFVGGAVALTTTIGTAVLIGANFDSKNVYIPDAVIDQIREHGPLLARKAGQPLIALTIVQPIES